MKPGLHMIKNLNFKIKLLIMVSSFSIILVLLVSIFNYQWHSQQISRQTINQTQQIIDQIGVNIDNYIDELYRLTLSPYYNDEIMAQLSMNTYTPEDTLTRKRLIENFLAATMSLPRDEILRVYILTDDDIFSYMRTPYEMQDFYTYQESGWYREALETTSPVFIPIHSEKAYGDITTQIFSIARQIRSKEDNHKTLGVIKVDANYNGIKSICDKVQLETKGALFVANEETDIVYQNSSLTDSNLFNQFFLEKDYGYFNIRLDGEKYIINVTTLSESGLKVIAVNSYTELTKDARTYRNRTILLVMICIIVSISLLTLFIQRFLSPLFDIIKLMKVVRTGDLTVRVEVKKNDEIGYLARSFNTMLASLSSEMQKNTELIKQVYEARYLHKESQYNALCSQIKPHFLHNTLNTVNLLIKCREDEKAIKCVENLSFFLRSIINADNEIPLSTEIRTIESYLEIQQIRYGDNLSYHINIPPAVNKIKIPALTLQPIVENAIKHGCETKRGKSHITILCRLENKLLSFTVTDDGKGMDYDTLNKLREKLDSNSDSFSNETDGGIGLINVHRRLKLKFGSLAGITIDSSPLQGTAVLLKIPISESREEDIPCV